MLVLQEFCTHHHNLQTNNPSFPTFTAGTSSLLRKDEVNSKFKDFKSRWTTWLSRQSDHGNPARSHDQLKERLGNKAIT